MTKASEVLREAAIQQLKRFSGLPGMPDIHKAEGQYARAELLAAFEAAAPVAGSCKIIADRLIRVSKFYPCPADIWKIADAIAAERAQATELAALNRDPWQIRCEACQDTGLRLRSTGNPEYPTEAVPCECRKAAKA